MKLCAQTELKISRPASEVFEAIVDPAKMAGYFISSGSGRMETGKTVTWKWDDVNAELAIQVRRVEPGKRIDFSWPASGVSTEVEIQLERVSDRATLVKIREDGWERDEQGIQRFGQQIHGWVHMLTCLKASLEHGINLRRDS
jgi:uncharacterized protein YndB with AHSA1/START domain